MGDNDSDEPRSARATLSVLGALVALVSVWIWRHRSGTPEGEA